MSEEEEFRSRDGEQQELIGRFEEMLEKDERYYFDADQFEMIIDHYMENSKYTKAFEATERAVEIFPNHTGIALREAQMMAAKGERSEAIPKLKNLLQYNPNNEDILIALATICSQIREHKEAIRYFKQALPLIEGGFKDDIYIELALEFENLEQWGKALQVLKEALKSNPKNETAIYELTYCYEELDQNQECLEYLEAFIEDHPYSFPAWYNLGNIYQKLDVLDKALESYEFALAINDQFGPAYLNKALVFVKQDQIPKAIETYKELLEIEPPQATTYCFIGECYERLELFSKAKEYYQMALDLDPQFPDAHVGMAMIYDVEGNFNAAEAALKTALDLEPEQIDFYLLYGTLLKRNQEYEKAEKVFTRALLVSENHEDIWVEYSDLLYLQDKLDEAQAKVDQGLDTIPFSIQLAYRKACLQILNGEREEGLQVLALLLATHFEKCESLFLDFPELANDPEIVMLFNDYKLEE